MLKQIAHRMTALAGLLLVLLLALPVRQIRADGGERLIVSPEGPYTTIAAALDDAEAGDIIEVRGGTYTTPLEIDKSVSLIGVDSPVLDGGGEGSLVIISAPGVSFQGFMLRNSGSNLNREDTGIVVQATDVTVADNVLENVLFGIFFANGHGSVARNNIVRGLDLAVPMRGDGIRIWYSNDVTIAGNVVSNTRDAIIWFADNVIIEDNTFHDNRYGLHFMYSSNALIENNFFENNSVGAYLMYSNGLTMRNNIVAYNRGPSGHGLALKDMDGVVATDNLFVGNRTGLFLDNSPFLYEGYDYFSGNVFAYNDIGVTALPAVERNIFWDNVFLDNIQQTSVRGRGTLQGNTWSQDGRGNYWSDYAGYDADGDGIGDIPYRAEKLFESLTDAYPELRLFIYSPAAQAIDFAAAAFPSLRPEPRLVDDAPLIRYTWPAGVMTGEGRISGSLLLVAGLLVVVGSITSASMLLWPGGPKHSRHDTPHTHAASAVKNVESNMIIAENLTKRYGQVVALNGVSFTIRAGEAVALWGTNGAGKTTALRCLLGMLPFEGQLIVNGLDVSRNSRAARTVIGYVPQEIAFYNMPVWEALRFYARLKKVPETRIEAALEQVGLTEHSRKSVYALSGGMKQRLALAAGLLSDPPILALDEPTANLDAQSRRDFLSLIRTLNQAGKTIVFSSHRLDEVVALAQRVLVLENGLLTLECPPDELTVKAGLQQWLRIRIPASHRDEALRLLQNQGITATPNGHAIYVRVGIEGKMYLLRTLEAGQITVEDFDLVGGEGLPAQESAS